MARLTSMRVGRGRADPRASDRAVRRLIGRPLPWQCIRHSQGRSGDLSGRARPAVRAKRVWAAGGRQTCSQKLRVSRPSGTRFEARPGFMKTRYCWSPVAKTTRPTTTPVALLARRRTRANCGVWVCFLVFRGVETACNSSGCSGTPFAGEAVFVASTFPQDPASCLRAWRGRSVGTESPCRPRLVSCPTLGARSGFPRPLRVCYGLWAAIGGTGSWRGIRRATRVQLGIHQLASPSSRIRAGTSSARMTVASRMIPAARPIASGLTS